MAIYLNQCNTTKATLNTNPYLDSEIEALIAGYIEVTDENAFNGRYFILNGRKWIHNLDALRKKLNAEYGHYIDDEELSAFAPEGFGYDIENYYSRFQNSNNLAKNKDFNELIKQIKVN
ncbi:hypothetical protein ACFFHT_04280 [Gallibacterium melopsittaci]|uniref:Uncharacterized protein n=1 Tax=Gallibacterium melopsittaci TaxID=516063 RepID=A0ABV6HXC9_9PAST